MPKFCWNQGTSCGLVWNDSAEQLSVSIKIILALFFGRLRDGVRNSYSLQTSLKSVWNKSWLIRKNKIVKVEDNNEAVNFCWTNITFILTYCVLASFPFARVLISKWMLMVVCQRFASFVLFCFLSFHKRAGVRKVVISNSKVCNQSPPPFGFGVWISFLSQKIYFHIS